MYGPDTSKELLDLSQIDITNSEILTNVKVINTIC